MFENEEHWAVNQKTTSVLLQLLDCALEQVNSTWFHLPQLQNKRARPDNPNVSSIIHGFHNLFLLDYILCSTSHIEYDSYTFQIMIEKHIGYHIHIVLLSQIG